eukprot:COSAG02_NODE_2353_length_9081_cov_4.981073_2_plen_104_part_00
MGEGRGSSRALSRGKGRRGAEVEQQPAHSVVRGLQRRAGRLEGRGGRFGWRWVAGRSAATRPPAMKRAQSMGALPDAVALTPIQLGWAQTENMAKLGTAPGRP